MKYFKTYKKMYDNAIKNEDHDFIDQVIMLEIWGLKWICRAYEKWAKEQGYDPLKADETYALSLQWATDVLFV